MKKTLFFPALICFLFSVLSAQIDLRGTIINQADFPVDSMEVALKDLGHTCLSDEDGKFQIAVTDIITKSQKELAAPKFKGSHFVIPVSSGTKQVSVEVYNLKGAKVATLLNSRLSAGEHSIPFNRTDLISSSVLIAIVRRGSDMTKFQIIKTGKRGFMVREFPGSVSNYSQTLETASKPLPALDSLQFIRRLTVEGKNEVFIEYTIPVDKWEDEFEVTLDLIPYEAIEYGKTQNVRGPTEVGKELEQQNIYPYDLYRYRNSSTNWAWCSEFYCYCMRVGGCPLGDDGGSNPDRPNWMLYGWDQLIEWFEDNAEYVEKSQITVQNFKPNPGDFVQMAQHTEMVRYIASNNHVFCVGGNVSNKVYLGDRGDYRTFSTLNGYGRRSGIIEDSHVSIIGK